MEIYLAKRLEEHIDTDDKMFEKISFNIEKIKDNHLAHIQSDVSALKVDMASVKLDVDWLKRYFFMVASASVGSLIVGIVGLALKQYHGGS